jgi:hypothetical protein
VNKPFGIYLLPILGIFYLQKEGLSIKKILNYKYFILYSAILFFLLFFVCWILVGDPLIYITIYNRPEEAPHITEINKYQMLIYPKQMFLKNEFGERLHGFHFYTVIICILLIRKKDLKKVLPILFWFLVIFSLINFFPQKVKGLIPYTHHRIFRYFVIVIPPSVIFISYFWNKLKIKNRDIFIVLFGLYVIISIYWCYDSTKIARIAFNEVRTALKYLKTLGDVDIYSDRYLVSKIHRLENSGRYEPNLHFWIGIETQEAWEEKFLSVEEGYVVTGGPRLPYYGCYRCIPNIGDFKPPENWTLIKEYDSELYPPWKKENLRIWYVSKE